MFYVVIPVDSEKIKVYNCCRFNTSVEIFNQKQQPNNSKYFLFDKK